MFYMLELGMKAQDKVTGFTGIVTGIVYYLSGSTEALVVPTIKPDGNYVEGRWFAIQMLNIVDSNKLPLTQ